MDPKPRLLAVVTSAFLLAIAAPFGGAAGQDASPDANKGLRLDCNPALSEECGKLRLREGRRLFDVETFGGNGRTCRTCHTKQTGTLSPEEIQERLREEPDDALFVHDGLDEGVAGTSRIAEHGTIRIEIPLPEGVVLAGDPEATSVIFNRGIPTTMNTPALDPLLMYDTREPNLRQQAFNAIEGHAQNTRGPTELELELIEEFQRSDPRFFSSEALRAFANGGPPPQLPAGTTESEKRGRRMFEPGFNGDTKQGICNICHSGPMLNRFSVDNPVGGPPFGRRGNIAVSERNLMGNPIYTFLVTDEKNTPPVVINSPDPGAMLNATVPSPPPGSGVPQPPRSFFAELFKIPTLWGVSRTAPYFHDNSAKTLEAVLEHYDFYFRTAPGLGFPITPQEQADIVAFLKLLR